MYGRKMNLLVREQRLSAATLPQTPGRKRRPKTSHVKYGLFFFMIFMMIAAVKVYLNYAAIQQSITDVKATIIQRQKDMQYLEVQDAYYHSEYAQILISHQQGILLPGEQFILFEHETPNAQGLTLTGEQTTGTAATGVAERGLSPRQSRKQYFGKKIQRIP